MNNVWYTINVNLYKIRHYKYAHAISLSIGLGWIILMKWYRELEAGDTQSLKSKWRDPGSNLAPLATPLQIIMCRRRGEPPKNWWLEINWQNLNHHPPPPPIWIILHIRPICTYFCWFGQIYLRVGMFVCYYMCWLKNMMMMMMIFFVI